MCWLCANPDLTIKDIHAAEVMPQPDASTAAGDTIGSTAGTAGSITVGGTRNGVTNFGGDQDWYAITVTAGQTLRFALNGAAVNGATASPDTYLRLFNGAGTMIAENDDGGPGVNSLLTYTFTTAGTYYISAGAYGSNTGGYTLTAETPPPPSIFTINQIADQTLNGYWASNGTVARRWAADNTDISFNVTGLTAERAAVARLAFATIADIAGLTFSETTGTAEITFDDNQSGAFASSSFNVVGGGPSTISSSIINVEAGWSGGTSATDSYTFQTFIHEILHTMGLGHGGNYNGSATYGVDNHYSNDTWQYTIMSYMDQSNFGGASYRYVMTPQMADILAMQSYYGAATTRAGNTTYGFNVAGLTGATAQLYNFANFTSAPSLTIYDSGGVDTLDVSGYTQNQLINLNGGTWSNIGGLIGNIGIYTTTRIENATGGSGNDSFFGNAFNNVLRGNGGNDVLRGGGGTDTMIGGTGNDVYVTDGGDTITELANQGTDTVQSSVTYTLGANLEYLTLTGTAPINGTGNALNNIITGNNAVNVLNGGGGTDTLRGGLGNDVYITDGGDTIVEAANAGTDHVRSSVTYILGANLEHLTLTGGGTINGSGNAGANIITGNNMNNVINGNGGADIMRGGLGNDTYVTDGGDTITELAGQGTDTVVSSVSYTLGANLENLRLTGSATMNGSGNGLNNVIVGNDGNNVLNGGAGIDTLIGGAGADRFNMTTALGANNIDRISDFVSGVDRLGLDNAVMAGLGANGNLNPSMFALLSGPIDANDRLIYDQVNGRLYYDSNGSGAGGRTQIFQFGANTTLVASDILVI